MKLDIYDNNGTKMVGIDADTFMDWVGTSLDLVKEVRSAVMPEGCSLMGALMSGARWRDRLLIRSEALINELTDIASAFKAEGDKK